MKEKGKRMLFSGVVLIVIFAIWTLLIQYIDVQPIGQNGTNIGFATWNSWFQKQVGANMLLYTITDWLGLVPILVCILFGGIGLHQLIRRKSLIKVDCDIIFLGIYYVIIIASYLIFERIPINYRPILIEGRLESSYPSSTVLLVLGVMPTLVFQVSRKVENVVFRRWINRITIAFSVFMVIGRLAAGVHWFTDIVGAALLGTGAFCFYKGVVLLCDIDKNRRRSFYGIS